MKNKLNPFEEQIKKAADRYEAPYDVNQWKNLEKELNRTSGFTFSNSLKLALVAVVISAVASAYFYTNNILDTATLAPEVVESKAVETAMDNSQKLQKEVPPSIEKQGAEKPNPALAETAIVDSIEQKTIEKPLEKTPEIIVEQKVTANPQKTIEKEGAIPEPEREVVQKEEISLPAIVSEKQIVCAGTAVSMYFEKPMYENITWNLGNGEKASGTAIEYIYLQPGTYHVVAYEEGKESNKTNTLTIEVQPKPDASFSVTQRLENGLVPVVEVNAFTQGAKHYSWNFGDGTSSTGESGTHTYQAKGDFEISLHVVNKFGCFWSGYQRYTNEVAYNLLAAGNFSPNGDGTNDYWMPKALASGYYAFDLQVYDRNNNVVFETSDPTQKWDGKVNGVTANSGAFFAWKATVVEPDNRRFQYGGSIILIY